MIDKILTLRTTTVLSSNDEDIYVGTSEGEIIIYTKSIPKKASIKEKEEFIKRLEKERTVKKYVYNGDEVFPSGLYDEIIYVKLNGKTTMAPYNWD